jgi:hypothetical protein
MTSHLFDYLEQFSKRKMSRLYEQPSAALAIFRRMLPHLGLKLPERYCQVLTCTSEIIRHGYAVHERASVHTGSDALGAT